MDGSKRSTKSNAFFTGFGKTKRIALFDTLIEKHSEDELVGVLAHEIGHYKKGHLVTSLLVGILTTGAMFFLLGLMMNNRSLFDAFGVKETSVYVSLVLFGIVMSPVNDLLSVAGNWLSRKHEFEADAYAAEVTGKPEALAGALRKAEQGQPQQPESAPFLRLPQLHPSARRPAARGARGEVKPTARLTSHSDLPLLHQVRRDLVEEAGRTLDHVAGEGAVPEERVGEIELVLRPGHGDIEKAAFFLETALVGVVLVDDAAVGEHALGEPDAEDDLPLKPLGLVDGTEADRFLVGLGRGGLDGVLSGEEAELAEELAEVVETFGVAFELLRSCFRFS